MTGALRTRLLIGAAGFITMALLLAAAGLMLLFDRHVKGWLDTELDAHLDQLIVGIDKDPSGALVVAKRPADPRFEIPLSGLYWQVAFHDGRDIRSRSLWDFAVALPPEPAVDARSRHHSVPGPGGQRLYLIQRNVELPARFGRHVARFAVARDQAEVDAAVWRFARALAPFLVILGLFLVAAAWLQVTIGLRPLASIRRRLADIRSGHSARLGTAFPDEVKPLARELDTLLDARERQLDVARQRAADLAHGLKTPLQVLAGGIAKLRAKGDDVIAGDLAHAAQAMQRHVDRQLARARMQVGGGTVSTSVREVAESVIRVLERTPEGRALIWHLAVPAGLSAHIHTDDLAEALGGLAENAARFARSKIAVQAARDAGDVVISVRDDGPGIPEEKFDEAIRRGSRLDTSGSGTGLGLAIASDIAEAWGGSIAFGSVDGLFSVDLRLRAAPERER